MSRDISTILTILEGVARNRDAATQVFNIFK